MGAGVTGKGAELGGPVLRWEEVGSLVVEGGVRSRAG